MPRRTLLSSEQRTRLFAIPIDPAEMARHYMLSTEDLTVIRAKRRTVNRLGFAIQLCLLRYPGQGLGPGEHPPEAMIVFVAHQLGVSPATFADYALRDQTRREHAVELQQHLRLRNFGLADWRACLQVGTNAASATDRGEPSSRQCSPTCGLPTCSCPQRPCVARTAGAWTDRTHPLHPAMAV